VTAALGIMTGVLALVIAGMAFRLAGLKADAVDADAKRHTTEKQFQETAREFAVYRSRTKLQLAALRQDIEELESDLEKCTLPGSRRARLERLLSKAADRENGGHPPKLPG